MTFKQHKAVQKSVVRVHRVVIWKLMRQYDLQQS